MKRGDIVTVSLQGDRGKPRPALVIQTDLVLTHPSDVVLSMTSTLAAARWLRVTVEPETETGLRLISQIMIDKPRTVQRERLGSAIGRVNDDIRMRVSRALVVWLGLA